MHIFSGDFGQVLAHGSELAACLGGESMMGRECFGGLRHGGGRRLWGLETGVRLPRGARLLVKGSERILTNHPQKKSQNIQGSHFAIHPISAPTAYTL